MAELTFTLTQDEIELLKDSLQSEIDKLEEMIENTIYAPNKTILRQRIEKLKKLNQKLGKD